MKNLILLFFFIFSSVAAQSNINTISQSQFDNISIDGVPLLSLKTIQNPNTTLNQLFSIHFNNTCNDSSQEALYLESWKLHAGYNYLENSVYSISSLKIVSNNVPVSILGVNLNIGTSIIALEMQLTNFVSQIDNDTLNQIAYISSSSDDSFFKIEYNGSTKLILSIEYFSF